MRVEEIIRSDFRQVKAEPTRVSVTVMSIAAAVKNIIAEFITVIKLLC